MSWCDSVKMVNYSKIRCKVIIITMLLCAAFVDSMAKDQKVSAHIEKLLNRVRRQAVDIGEMCTSSAMCMAGNGGPNSECVVPPMDEVLLCACLPGFDVSELCVAVCTTNADCPVTNLCVDGQCAPPCDPIACDMGNCPPPLICNSNNVCVPDCRDILPIMPTTTTTTAPTTTDSSPPSTKPPTTDVPPILKCDEASGDTCSSDRNAICVNNVCVCIPGTTLKNGCCVIDGGPPGFCDSNHKCPRDKNSMCDTNTNMCVCVPGATLLDGACIESGLPGGRCEFGECRDLNAVCEDVHGIDICVCKPGTTKIEGVCLQDGAVGGRCDGDGFMCTRDQYAECQEGYPFGICVCIEGAKRIEGMCLLDGVVGGKCNGKYDETCARDPNAECIDGYCVCKPGTEKVEGSCVATGKPGARCSNDGYCPYDILATCASNSTCTCTGKSIKLGDNCVADGYDGGRCSFWKCFNKHAVCDPTRNRCVCRPGSTLVAGKCITLELLHWIHIHTRVSYHDRANSKVPMLAHKVV